MDQGNNYHTKALVISIKEILWYLLEQWKAIVLFALCVMFLFLGLMKVRYSSYAKTQQQIQSETKSITAQDIIESLPENEQEFVLSAYHLFQEREYLSEYINTAPIMQIDPNHSKRLRCRWAVDGVGLDSNALAMSYVMELQDESHRTQLLHASGVELEEERFNDLLFITYPDEIGHNVVCCDFFLTEGMKVDSLKEGFAHEFETINAELQDELGEHQIRNFNCETAIVSDERVYKKQTDVYQHFTNISIQLNNLNNLFSANQKEAFRQLQNLDKETFIDDSIQIVPKTITLRNLILGLLFGIVIYIGIYFLYLVLSGIIISSDVFEDSSIRILGEWHRSSDKKNKVLMRDRNIWKRHHRKHLSRDVELNRISNAVESICKYRHIGNLLIVLSGELSEAQDTFMSDLTDSYENYDIRVKTIATSRTDGMINETELISADGVMLVIIEGESRFKDLNMVFDRCNEYNKSIIGSVYMG